MLDNDTFIWKHALQCPGVLATELQPWSHTSARRPPGCRQCTTFPLTAPSHMLRAGVFRRCRDACQQAGLVGCTAGPLPGAISACHVFACMRCPRPALHARARAPTQVDGFYKAAQKVGKGLSRLFSRSKSTSNAGAAQFGLEELMLYTNVRVANAPEHRRCLHDKGRCRTATPVRQYGWVQATSLQPASRCCSWAGRPRNHAQVAIRPCKTQGY